MVDKDQTHNPDDPREAFTPDLQPRLDAKRVKLEERIKLIQEQEAAELARFPAAPADSPGKASKSK